MTRNPGDTPTAVVIDPGLLAHEILTPEDRGVCTAWRNGLVIPAFSKFTLDHALKLLCDMGLRLDAIEIWALWMTRRDRTIFVPAAASGSTLLQEYEHTILQAHAAGMVTDRPADLAGKLSPGIPVLTPDDLTRILAKTQGLF